MNLLSQSPNEASEMLFDSEVMKTIKRSFLDKHAERKNMLSNLDERMYKIDLRKIDDFSKWFIKEFVSVMWQKPIGELTRTLNHLRIAIIKTDKKFVIDRKGYENWQERVEEARRYPILGLVSQFVQPKRSASRFVACCPFHQEKSASFTIYPKTNTAHCFGCNWSGDSIKFLMDYRQFSFKEAVSELSI
jgi:hypothetical protein